MPGDYRVDVIDLPPMHGRATPERGRPAPWRAFPHRYATDSPLTVTIDDGGQPMTLDFELQSTP